MEKFDNLEEFMNKFDNLDRKEIWTPLSEKSVFSSFDMSWFSSRACEKFDSSDKEKFGQFRLRSLSFQV